MDLHLHRPLRCVSSSHRVPPRRQHLRAPHLPALLGKDIRHDVNNFSKIARKSVVIIADKKDEDAYCSGCVMIKDGAVTVIASSDFVKGRERHLKVVFSDREELEATVVAVQDSFHPGCEAISLL